MRIVRLSSGVVRHVRTEAGEAFFNKPIGSPITEAEYQDLLRKRREAQKLHPKGHPTRLDAERAVRQARKQRGERDDEIDRGIKERGDEAIRKLREKRLAEIDTWVKGLSQRDLEYAIQEQELRHYEPDEQQAIRDELRRREDEAEKANPPVTATTKPLEVADEDSATVLKRMQQFYGESEYEIARGLGWPTARVSSIQVQLAKDLPDNIAVRKGIYAYVGDHLLPVTVKPKQAGPEVETVSGQLNHQALLDARREARAKYPAGHPERVRAEQAVRKSRLARNSAVENPGDKVPSNPESAKPEPAKQPLSETKHLEFEDVALNGRTAWRAITDNGRYLIEKRGPGDYTITAIDQRVMDAGGAPEKAVQTVENIPKLSDAFDAVEEFERSGSFFGTGPEKTAWQSEPGYQELHNGYEVVPYGVPNRTGNKNLGIRPMLSFHPTAEANATRWFGTRREAEEFIKSKPQLYHYDPYWKRGGKSGPTSPAEADAFVIKRTVNGQLSYGSSITRNVSDRVYFGNSGHPTDDIPIAFTDTNVTRGTVGREQAAAISVRSQMQHQYDFAPALVEEVNIAVTPKIEVEHTDKAVGVNVVRGTIGSDVDNSISLHKRLFPSLNEDPTSPPDVLRQCQEQRHWVPTDAKWSLSDVVTAHETGHGMAYRTFGTTAKGLPTGKLFWEDFTAILRDEKRRKLGGGPAYEKNLPLPTILGDYDASDSDKAAALESWAQRNKVVLTAAVSKYGATNLRELLAEMWAEYTLSVSPRPAAKFYGDYARSQARQRNRKAGVL